MITDHRIIKRVVVPFKLFEGNSLNSHVPGRNLNIPGTDIESRIGDTEAGTKIKSSEKNWTELLFAPASSV